MPNRAERRAAERAALKANRLHAQAQKTTATESAEKAFAVGATESIPESTTPSEAPANTNFEPPKHSQPHRIPGFTGNFFFLACENPARYHELAASVYAEYNPQTDTEARLADSIIRHYWLIQRAIIFQTEHFTDEKKLALFLRYQSVHERSYYKAQKELIQLQKDRAKEQIGFESQNAKTRLTNARAENLEIDTACRKVMEVPLPGNYRISFEQLAHACSAAISSLVIQQQQQSEAAGCQPAAGC